LLTNAAGVTRPEYIRLEVDSRVTDGFVVTISRERDDNGIDVNKTETDIRTALLSDPNSFQIDNAESSGAVALSLGVAVVIVALLA